MSTDGQKRISRWYFGGIASAGAACCTHPLDLLKVHLQTTATKGTGKQPGLVSITINIVKNQGVFALYNGLSASLLRQLTYSTTRFGIYETAKQYLSTSSPPSHDGVKGPVNIPFYQKVLLAGASGAAGGWVGTPADMINVRMQNDIKLPLNERRNYKHAIDGLLQVYQKEGIKRIFNGATMATSRAVLMTIGQLSMYDQYKYLLLFHLGNYFSDNLLTHFVASLMAGATATTLTQPMDVMKTRMMNSRPGEYNGVGHCAKVIFTQLGLFGFFKGYVPAFVRLAPQTILTFVFFEQLRLRFGSIKS